MKNTGLLNMDSVGTLYVVATPIGNLRDISLRAKSVLASVDIILAEDTRHSRNMLAQWGISTPCEALHEHNERHKTEHYLALLQTGKNLALISDAGTPLISDPGYFLLSQIQAQAMPVVPVPGASAILTALSVAGLATHRFTFIGFLPAKSGMRKKQLGGLQEIEHTLIFYEAPHRILACLYDLLEVFGAERRVLFARELTKTYETLRLLPLQDLVRWVEQDKNQQRGEIVLVVEGNTAIETMEIGVDTRHTVEVLLAELPLKQAVDLAIKITGERKKKLYQYALSIKDRELKSD